MTNLDPKRFRPLTRQELETLGYSSKPGSKFYDFASGQVITRRQRENLRVQALTGGEYQTYGRYQRETQTLKRESDRLYQTFLHIRSTMAPGIPIPELNRATSREGRELRALYDATQRAYKNGDDETYEEKYQELLDLLDLPNPRIDQDWQEIWQRYRGAMPSIA